MDEPGKKRFDLLDGLRGVAALAVMTMHVSANFKVDLLPGASVAVDLFFVLSGFVIAHSYGEKILGGLRFRAFAAARLIRLGPLYLMGLAIAVLACVTAHWLGRPLPVPAGRLVPAVAAAAFGLPYFGDGLVSLTDPTTPLFPLNGPAWSLSFELFANAAFYLLAFRSRILSSRALIVASYALLVGYALITHRTNPGWSGYTFPIGFSRVSAGFFLGAWIYSAGLHLRPASALSAIALFALACLGVATSNALAALALTVVFVPATVLESTRIEVSGWAKRVCAWLGDLSYPLYILHVPILALAALLPLPDTVPRAGQILLVGVATIFASAVSIKPDRALRKALMATLLGKRPRSTAEITAMKAARST